MKNSFHRNQLLYLSDLSEELDISNHFDTENKLFWPQMEFDGASHVKILTFRMKKKLNSY
jgi:hypothetical protein